MRNHLGHEARAAKAGQKLSAGTPPEVAKQPLADAAAGPYQDVVGMGLAQNAAAKNTPPVVTKMGPIPKGGF